MLPKLILELPASIAHHTHRRHVLGVMQHNSHRATSLQQQGKGYGTMEQHVADNIWSAALTLYCPELVNKERPFRSRLWTGQRRQYPGLLGKEPPWFFLMLLLLPLLFQMRLHSILISDRFRNIGAGRGSHILYIQESEFGIYYRLMNL